MLNALILNGLDVTNIMYLWAVLNKNKEWRRLIFSIVTIFVLTTLIQNLDLNFMYEYAISIIIIKIVYRINLKDIVFNFLLAQLINMSLQLIFTLFIEKMVYNKTLIVLFTELAIFCTIIILSKANFSKSINSNNIDTNIIIHFALIFSIYAVVFKIIWNYDSEIILDNLFVIASILTALIITQILTYLHVAKLTKEKLKLKVSSEYNEVIDEIVKEIKQRQHDFVNYKNTIKGIVNVVDKNDIKDAISNYIKDEDVYDDKINALIYIDNVVVRSIIYRNMCKLKKYNIDFEYEIENDVLDNVLTYHEISNVLNNLLNNAFEEVVKDECIKKSIKINIFNKDKTAHLIVKNQLANIENINLNDMFTIGYSTKDKGTRGYGLYNVQSIINSHKGNIKINLEDGQIIFDIYIQK